MDNRFFIMSLLVVGLLCLTGVIAFPLIVSIIYFWKGGERVGRKSRYINGDK